MEHDEYTEEIGGSHSPEGTQSVSTEVTIGLLSLLGLTVSALVWVLKNKWGRSNGDTKASGFTQRLEKHSRTDERLDAIEQSVREIKKIIDKEDSDGYKLVYGRAAHQKQLEERLGEIARMLRELVSSLR